MRVSPFFFAISLLWEGCFCLIQGQTATGDENAAATLRETLKRSSRLQSKARTVMEQQGHLAPKHLRDRAQRMLDRHRKATSLISETVSMSSDPGYSESPMRSKVEFMINSLRSHEQSILKTYNRLGGDRAVRTLANIGNAQISGRRELRATSKNLELATGVSSDDEVWGSLFRVVDELFQGDPPAEALGVSAKFKKDEALRARYHVALQPPCECWSLDRSIVLDRSREIATVLQAPALVYDWIGVLGSISEEETLPALGFGISRDDGACKLYVMNQQGKVLPKFPLLPPGSIQATIDEVLPPVTSGKSVMVSLEWEMGKDALAIRQYSVEEQPPSFGGGARSNEERIASFGNADLARSISDLLFTYGGATEDIAVTIPYVPETVAAALETNGGSEPLANFVEVSKERSKLGMKLFKTPEPSSEDEVQGEDGFLDRLIPVLKATGIDSEGTREAVAGWLEESSSVHHAVSNIQVGGNFVTLYRHPSTFGHLDVNAPEQYAAFRRALGHRQLLRTGDDDVVPLTSCEQAQSNYEDAVIWGDSDCGDDAMSSTTCPSSCQTEIADLISGCSDCATQWQVCEGQADFDVMGDDQNYGIKFDVLFDYRQGYDGCSRYDNEDIGQYLDDLLAPLQVSQSFSYSYSLSYLYDVWGDPIGDFGYEKYELEYWDYDFNEEPDGDGELIVHAEYYAYQGAIGAADSQDFFEKVKTALTDGYNNVSVYNYSNCKTLLVSDSISALEENSSYVTQERWDDVPLSLVPSANKWLQPYGGGGLMETMSLWGPDGCQYPWYDFMPEDPLCNECSSVVRTMESTAFWGIGPCVNKQTILDSLEEEWDDYEQGPFGLSYLSMSYSLDGFDGCPCDCSRAMRDIEEYCEIGECGDVESFYAAGSACASDCGVYIPEDGNLFAGGSYSFNDAISACLDAELVPQDASAVCFTAGPEQAESYVDDDDDDTCFSGDSIVQLASGATKSMADLEVGDSILSADAAGKLSFSEVVFLPHGANSKKADFVALTTESGKIIKATPSHLLQACDGSLVQAKAASCLRTVDGAELVKSIKQIKAEGIYTAVTLKNEFLVVDGVVASPFALAHTLADAYYNAHRVLYAVSPSFVKLPSMVPANSFVGAAAMYVVRNLRGLHQGSK